MSQAQPVPVEPAVRASDGERDQAAEVLRDAYAEGRLTRAELDQRTGAAHAAKTRADLSRLTRDLPARTPAQHAHRTPANPAPRALAAGTGAHPDRCLLLCLLIAFPPAGITYWILTARRHPPAHPPDAPTPPAGAAS